MSVKKEGVNVCDCFVDDGETAHGVVFNGFCELHATAPELLEALKMAQAELWAIEKVLPEWEFISTPIMDAIDNALNKAERRG